MSKYYILYNPKAKSGTGLGTAESVKKYATGDVEMVDITAIGDYADFLSGITDEDSVVICGGDGTLTRFINYAGDAKLPKNLYFRSEMLPI